MARRQPVHHATCPAVTNVTFDLVSNQPVTGIVYRCYRYRAVSSGFLRLGTREDTDGDGLSDAYETLAFGSDPDNPDSDGDGVPDGAVSADWLAHPLWAANAGATNLVISLSAPLPSGAAPVLSLGTLAIPLATSEGPWSFCLPEGELVECILHNPGTNLVALACGPPDGSSGPLWCEDHADVFDGNAGGGRCRFAVPVLDVEPEDGSVGRWEFMYGPPVRGDSPRSLRLVRSVCLHDLLPVRHRWTLRPDAALSWLVPEPVWPAVFSTSGDLGLVPSATEPETIGYLAFRNFDETGANSRLWGTLSVPLAAHRCEGFGEAFCLSCGRRHGSAFPCFHAPDCATGTNLQADCDCAEPFVRIGRTGAFALAGAESCCCSAAGGIPPELLSSSAGLGATIHGDALRLAPVEASPTIGGFSARYWLFGPTGGVHRTLTFRATAADLGIDPCLSGVSVPYAEDAEAYFVTNGVLHVARRAAPYPIRLWNQSPSDARLVLSFASPTNGPRLRPPSDGDGRGSFAATNESPWCALNDDRTVYLDASCSNAPASLSLTLSDPATNRTFLSESLSVQVVDTALGEHWRVRSATDRIAWDFSDAPEDVWIGVGHAGANGVLTNTLEYASSKTPSLSLDLPPGDYALEAYFPRVYDGVSSAAWSTNTLHIRPVPEFARDVVGVQCWTDRRVEVALTNDTFHSDIQWTLSPIVANGPRLFAASNSVSGATSLLGVSNVWVSAGTIPGVYRVEASYPGCTNSTAYVVDPVIDINGDFFRNGTIADDPREADPVCFTNAFGIVIPCNNDDSDGDGIPDCGDGIVNGVTDAGDLRRIVIAGMGLDNAPEDILSRIRIRIVPFGQTDDAFPSMSPWQKIRLFSDDENGTEGWPEDLDGAGYDLRDLPAEEESAIDLFVEGRTHGASLGVRLEAMLDGTIFAADSIRLRVAPFIVNPNTDRTDMVFLSDSFPGFILSSLQTLQGVVGWTGYGNGYIQDFAEIGTAVLPTQAGVSERTSVWGFFGDRFRSLLTNDVGYFEGFIEGGVGGDIEALPASDGFPYGRVVIGTKNTARVPALRDFFIGQSLQVATNGPIELPTGWLTIGHVDEIMSVVPKRNGYFVVVADFNLAIHCLRDAISSNNQEVPQHCVAMMSRLENPDNESKILHVQNQLDTAAGLVATAMRISTNELTRIPVLFNLPSLVGTNFSPVVSCLPNSVNMVTAKTDDGDVRLLIPDPGILSFQTVITNRLISADIAPDDISFVDTTELASGDGYAHCANNQIRTRSDDDP